MRLLACLFLLTAAGAFAQVSAVDPDAEDVAPAPKPKKPAPRVVEDNGDGTLVAPPTVKKPAAATAKKPVAAEPVKPVEEPKKPQPPELVVRTLSDGDLNAIWRRWADANAAKNDKAEAAARKELLATKQLINSPGVELWAVGLLRAAEAWEDKGDSGAAVEIAVSATELAPQLPATWWLQAKLLMKADPSGVGRWLSAMQSGVAAQLKDSRYLRPLAADVVAVLLISSLVTAGVVLLVLALRRLRYFLYDFHFFFPRAAARWQTAAIALLLLALPVVFRMGVAPALLGVFAALTLYLSMQERVVVAALIGFIGFIPSLAALTVEHTAFAETPAEDLYRIERGGPGIEPLVQHYEQLTAEDKTGFVERFVLGHYHLNRGHLDQAVTQLKGALTMRPDDVPARLALGKALLLQGDLENSKSLFEAMPQSAEALFNLSRVYTRRVQLGGDAKVGELDKANEALQRARQLDATLPAIASDEPEQKEITGNTWLKSVGVTQADLLSLAKGEAAAARVKSQLTQQLIGDVPAAVAPFFPLLAACALVAFGSLSRGIQAAKECNRCGRAVSKRGDPELPYGSGMCSQCVNVFAKKNAVAPSVKVRKQLEVARYEGARERFATILGVAVSGMGHVFNGQPVRGVVFGFLFAVAVVGAVLRDGVVRSPGEGAPLLVRLLPALLLFVIVYPLALFALRKKAA